jgi:hypothetical protein
MVPSESATPYILNVAAACDTVTNKIDKAAADSFMARASSTIGLYDLVEVFG